MSEPFAVRADRSSGRAPTGESSPQRQPAEAVLAADTGLAIEVRELLRGGDSDQAQALFERLVEAHHRRALRIAYHYLRDRTEAEDAVQDTFLKVYSHIGTYREMWPFGVWFTRILVNACIDRQKARTRRARWFAPAASASEVDGARPAFGREGMADPEAALLARERWNRLAGAVGRLAGRQRAVFLLCHYGDWTPREVSAMLGLNESTVRVHLFRAAHKLRSLLGPRR